MTWDPMEMECNISCQKDQLESNAQISLKEGNHEMVGSGSKYQEDNMMSENTITDRDYDYEKLNSSKQPKLIFEVSEDMQRIQTSEGSKVQCGRYGKLLPDDCGNSHLKRHLVICPKHRIAPNNVTQESVASAGVRGTDNDKVLIVRPLEVEPGTRVTSSDKPNIQAPFISASTIKIIRDLHQTNSSTTLLPTNETPRHQIDATLDDVEMEAFYASLDAEASATSVLSPSQELASAVPCEKTKKSLKALKEFLSKDFSTLLLPEQCSTMKTTLEQLSNLSSNDGISVEMLMLILEISRGFTQWSHEYNCANRKIELASTNLLKVDKLEEGLEANKKQFKESVSRETELSNQMAHLEERERELEEQINAIKSNISSFQTDGTSSMQPEPVQCNQLAHLEERKKELEEQISATKCDISSFQTTKNAGTKRKREIFEEARTLKAQRDELREQIPHMREDSESAKKMQETIRAEWSKLGEKFNKSFGGVVRV